jgi:hypothetical protein
MDRFRKLERYPKILLIALLLMVVEFAVRRLWLSR